MTRSALEAHDLVVERGGTPILKGLNVQMAPSDVTVLLGPNGVGKSTLLRAALGIAPKKSGKLKVFGLDVHEHRDSILTRVGFVPDVPDVDPHMCPRSLGRYLRGFYKEWDPVLYADRLDRYQIPSEVEFQNLSRGQGKKAMLAAALATDPEFLLLDEPFAGLDPLASEEVLRSVIQELKDGDRGALCATHDIEVAARIADRIAVLNNGVIHRYGTLDEILGVVPDDQPAGLKEAYRTLVLSGEKA